MTVLHCVFVSERFLTDEIILSSSVVRFPLYSVLSETADDDVRTENPKFKIDQSKRVHQEVVGSKLERACDLDRAFCIRLAPSVWYAIVTALQLA